MKKMFFIAALFLSMNAEAQTYDLVRSVVVYKSSIDDGLVSDDTASPSVFNYSQTGTLEINGNKITRKFHTCNFGSCGDYVFNDTIYYADDKIAGIGGDSGDVVVIRIIALSPNIIILHTDSKLMRIEEYKIR